MKGQLAAVVIDQWRAAGVRIGRFFSTFWAPDRPSILQSSRLWFDLAADLDPLMAAASCKTSTWRLLHLGVQLLFGQSMSPARRPHCQWSVCVSSHIAIDFCNFHWPTADTLLIVTTSSFIKASESPAAAEKKQKKVDGNGLVDSRVIFVRAQPEIFQRPSSAQVGGWCARRTSHVVRIHPLGNEFDLTLIKHLSGEKCWKSHKEGRQAV